MSSRRRKGERPVDKSQFYAPYDETHPVARAIRTGSRWFEAWQFQNALPTVRLAKLTGIPQPRISELHYGAAVTEAEVSALAAAYGVQPSDIIASLPNPQLLIRRDGSDGRNLGAGDSSAAVR
ncbi:hypothetical protein HHL26_04810 [Sphingobium sp. TB-6]|uniref:helix-turn-helix domain-containing protein n=1 Tax=Sphingobium sp. TB-6 TaxID=2728850 RepID=UPI00146F5EB0|nr:helix-turn-helix transcriptional regulator [Sphingobium sp. TB-6]NML88386.1 hypothetical protein [Sphingobium sp. TB-6]